ncbi:hypothetical protein KDI_31980 [Dictyobacter arantiisoli]|uniref:Uncharacterized protein n=1 Tax=Dictyobacter arantiisoli TaxID=2014874 RepID=A0A5A5TFE7_9CHLR|nr:hypothetical protein KDI_31980 [Dictyobacter arantiisoli]
MIFVILVIPLKLGAISSFLIEQKNYGKGLFLADYFSGTGVWRSGLAERRSRAEN